jgi:arabinoxylan arabinofuranohydrolase
MKTILFTLFVAIFSAFVVADDASAFNGVRTARNYKDIKNHNPINVLKYSADPGVMVYDGRVYVYATNDGIGENIGNNPRDNDYSHINTINVMSSSDMVNWVDHGTIPAAGNSGAAKWAGNSWAPCAAHKKINGKEKFFLYFANSGNGIGVLTSDSPTGPFVDPIGGPLVSRSTPNCNSIVWLFDPAVMVDDDGTGYLYFGGGVPENAKSNPKTVRAVKLGNDMISLAGTPQTIDAPWVFEDSGINKAGNTYFYSYCTNWDNGPYGNAKIAYMTSSSPLGPFQYQGTVLNNPGDFFGTVGNNHHTIINFKNKWYIFYHAEWLNKQVFGSQKGFRTSHVDELPFSNGKFGNAKGSLTGVSQLENVDAFKTYYASMMAWEGGVSINGLGHTTVTYNKGDWTGVSNVDFGNGAYGIKVSAASRNGAVIKIAAGSETGNALGYINIPATGGTNSFKTVTASLSKITGVKNIFFIASGDVVLDTWQFTDENGSGSTEPINDEPVNNDPVVEEPVQVDTVDEGWYFIKNPSTGKYLTASGNSVPFNVIISTGYQEDNQKWKVTNAGNGYITLTSGLGDYMLDVANGSANNDANIQVYSAYGGDAQQFKLVEYGSGEFAIVTKSSNDGKAVDIANNGYTDGTNVLQWTNSGKSNQIWVFEKIGGGSNNGGNNEAAKCWSEPLGYPCCSECGYSYYSDSDGEWGVENDDWCGLLPSCF